MVQVVANNILGLETQEMRINFEVLDPDLGCLVLEIQEMRIHFGRGSSGGLQAACGWPEGPPKSWSDSGIHFPRKYAKILQFYTVWEPPGVQNRIKTIKRINRMNRMKAKWYTTGSSDPRFLTRLRSG